MAKEKADQINAAEQNQAAAEELLHQNVLEILRNVSPDQLVTITPDAEVVKGTAYRSTAWLHGPANMEFLAVAAKRLNKVAARAGMSVRQVEKAQSILIKGTKNPLWPALVIDLGQPKERRSTAKKGSEA